ncbi:unnamed protein product [Rangifer tarandus platyrhynchus]|uniref:Uncharacterized protein n=2 Tax=Rangifer tarandus platyrhynchus TaxID=3082113 RepID=A0ABN8YUP7_RANTA|nr:unnamed protein product [Rangifer tarandus platyrhynchus]CAI9702799.1 unnamed protein product [Rangifer tarandus platyrhynchus]
MRPELVPSPALKCTLLEKSRGRMSREMLCKNLWESSGVENRLINDAELSELLMGSGLGAHNGPELCPEVGVLHPPLSPALPKYVLADYRYGREEMLALFLKHKEEPSLSRLLCPSRKKNRGRGECGFYQRSFDEVEGVFDREGSREMLRSQSWEERGDRCFDKPGQKEVGLGRVASRVRGAEPRGRAEGRPPGESSQVEEERERDRR